MMLHIDFETYSRLDVRNVGAYRYAQDPSTEVLICCYAIGNGPIRTWLPWRDPEMPDDLREAVESGMLVAAHNAQFEMCIWAYILVERFKAPPVKVSQWVCTAARAAMASLPRSLEKACAALGLPVQKDKSGARLITRFCKPRKPTKNDPRTRILPRESWDEFKQFIAYCRTDVKAERGLDEVLPHLPSSERALFALDMRINTRGLPIDIDCVEKASTMVRVIEADIIKRVQELTGGIRPTQVQQTREWLATRGVKLANMKLKTLQRTLAPTAKKKLPADVREVLELRIEASKVSTKKLAAMQRVVCADGRARGTLLFYGAHTGRWAGRLIQPQNFTRGTLKYDQFMDVFDMIEHGNAYLFEALYDKPMSILAQCMRGFIKAPPGKRFLVVDYKAIEARVLAWMAEEQAVLSAYFNGLDVYVLMAAKLYGVRPEQVTPEQRRIGKNLVLGCGYGLGAEKFIEYCEKEDIFIDLEFSQQAVGGYRESHPNILKFWRDVERSAIAAVRDGTRVRLRNLAFEVEGDYLTIELPSKRKLYYPFPEVTNVVTKYGKHRQQLTFMTEFKGKLMRASTYGGRLVENIVQAIARDFMVHGMFAAEAHGYPVVGTVHDELITLVKNTKGKLKELEHVVCQEPEWGHGCPIASEGFETVRYRKG